MLLVPIALLYWWQWHTHRKDEREHAEALAAFADEVGGKVVGRDEARAWSADLLSPLRHQTEGFFNKLGTRRRARFDTAIDFRRDGWPVRVSEASIRKSVPTAGTTTIYEYRIEVAVDSVLPPMRISQLVHADFRGRPLPPTPSGYATEPPSGAPQWLPARLPAEVEQDFAAYTTDPVAVARAFTPQVVEWMVGRTDEPSFLSTMPFLLHFEGGLVFATIGKRIDTETLLPRVDAIIGLISRLGDRPALR
ncbi:hypothetical protein [Saccharothrix violaceirubra]|uniref:Uncharacterized protein n=2 Tax=Saccharothrix violaceirubra TaxID=413306 RepID=A0A7W7T4N8_9PSEU|nr:hypothetical protein [Saccharothrix violaceirubra]MBB4966236.1 hypothetical protein [Saccharothrix violaceirubra]